MDVQVAGLHMSVWYQGQKLFNLNPGVSRYPVGKWEGDGGVVYRGGLDGGTVAPYIDLSFLYQVGSNQKFCIERQLWGNPNQEDYT